MLAEYNVIGALLMDDKCISQIAPIITPEMFNNKVLGRIYKEYLKGYDNRYEVTMAVLEQNIIEEEIPSGILTEQITSAITKTDSTAGIKSNAVAVKRDYMARIASAILDTKFEPNGISSQIGDIITKLEALISDRSANMQTLAEIADKHKDEYFKERNVKPIHTGFNRLDDLLGGLEGGDVIVIGARPAVGKSALVTQISRNFSDQGKNVAYYNLEMSDKQVYERFVVNISGIALTRLRRATNFLNDEKERFDKANEVISSKSNLHISTGAKSVSEIRSEARYMDYDVIIIDYLQLLRSDKSYSGNRYAEVGAISKAIKALAMELNVPILLLSQLNRVSEGKETKEPSMAELRESGDIEQDASVIILMWNLDDERKRKGLKVDKNRQGNTGKEVLMFNGEFMRFEETTEDIKQYQKGFKGVDTSDCPFG